MTAPTCCEADGCNSTAGCRDGDDLTIGRRYWLCWEHVDLLPFGIPLKPGAGEPIDPRDLIGPI